MTVQIKADGPANNYLPTESFENQLTDIISNPRLNITEREGKVKEEFAKLSADEAKELYQNLTSKDHPLSRQFQSQFAPATAKNLTNSLKALFEPAGSSIQESPGFKQPSPQALQYQKSERVMEGKAQEIQMRNQLLAAGDPKMMKQIKQISQDPNIPKDQKAAEIRKHLENASPDDFKSFLAYSKGWTKEDKKALTSAMAGSEAVMKRIAKELPKEDQLDAFQRIRNAHHLTGEVATPAMTILLKEVSPESFNQISKKEPGMVGYLMGMSTEVQKRFGQLEPPLQKEIFGNRFTSEDNKAVGTMLSSMTLKDQENLIRGLSESEKNTLINDLQNSGGIPSFLESLKFTDLGNVLLDGLTQKNAAFISRSYAHLEKYAPTVELKKKYAENALHVDGWIENRFHKE